ncbi:TLDc domain-containing protein [Entamoeba marina]
MKRTHSKDSKYHKCDHEYIVSFNEILNNNIINWSGLNNYTVLFDSDNDGNGFDLFFTVLNKKNLYFITFDNNNNVFGGYISTTIDHVGFYEESTTFIYSLMKNGQYLPLKYNPISSQYNLFYIQCYYGDDYSDDCNENDDNSILTTLYNFGLDLQVHKIGIEKSQCEQYSYESQKNSLVNNEEEFIINRIIVVEMY